MPLPRARNPRVEGRGQSRLRSVELEARLRMLLDPIQPIGQCRPGAKRPGRLDAQKVLTGAPGEPLGRRVQHHDSTPNVDGDDRVVDSLDNGGPRHRCQIQQAEPEQSGQEGQPSHHEAHRDRIG